MLNMVTVGELIEHLKEFPEGLPVIYRCCSDWTPLCLKDVSLVKGVQKEYWVMGAFEEHISTMSAENRDNIREFVGFPGN